MRNLEFPLGSVDIRFAKGDGEADGSVEQLVIKNPWLVQLHNNCREKVPRVSAELRDSRKRLQGSWIAGCFRSREFEKPGRRMYAAPDQPMGKSARRRNSIPALRPPITSRKIVRVSNIRVCAGSRPARQLDSQRGPALGPLSTTGESECREPASRHGRPSRADGKLSVWFSRIQSEPDI
jgi:hypothetical protein